MKNYYPLFLDVRNRLCLVVGGGAVAQRKVKSLLEAGARVKVVAPRITGALRALRDAGKIVSVERPFREDDIADATLVFAATGEEKTNHWVAAAARAQGVFVNVVDDPGQCDFIVPSMLRRGPVTIAISSGGAAPSVSKKVRMDLERALSRDYTRYAAKVAKFRQQVMRTVPDPQRRAAIMRAVASADVAEVSHMSPGEMKERFLRGGNDSQC